MPTWAILARNRSASPGSSSCCPAWCSTTSARARSHPSKAAANPFFLLGPDWAGLPLVILATMATVIASQAMISGAYSVTRQCVQLGFLPRMTVRHTSTMEEGQIYMPQVNAPSWWGC